MPNQILNLTDFHWANLHHIKQVTGLTMNEINRRFYDYCLSQAALNQIVPSYSGQIKVQR